MSSHRIKQLQAISFYAIMVEQTTKYFKLVLIDMKQCLKEKILIIYISAFNISYLKECPSIYAG